MTSNQIARDTLAENQRSNRAKEAETHRSNRRNEKIATANAITTGFKNVVGTLIAPFTKGKGNDKSWYEKDKNLLNNAANFVYGTPLGSVDDIKNNIEVVVSKQKFQTNSRSVPGAMVLQYIPALPDQATLDVTMRSLYSFIRHQNSGSRNYEAQDLFMYVLSISDVYALVAHSTRVYSLLNDFKSSSYFYNKSVLDALDIDVDDFSKHITDFRAQINVWISRINAFAMPNNMPVFNRRIWLNSCAYKDYPIRRSTDIFFKQEIFYKYNEENVAENVGAQLDAVVLPRTYYEYVETVTGIINALFESEDIGIISGDILKVYGESGIVKIAGIGEDYKIDSIYSEEVLSQINNAILVGNPIHDSLHIYTRSESSNRSIYQGNLGDPSVPENTEIKFTSNRYSNDTEIQINDLVRDKITINMYKDDVEPSDNAVATRLAATYESDGFFTDPIEGFKRCQRKIRTHANEICTVAKFCIRSENRNIILEIFDGKDVSAENFLTPGELCTLLSSHQSVDWAPSVVYMHKTYNNAVDPLVDTRDYANYTIISEENFKTLNTVIDMSLYNMNTNSNSAR